MTTTTLDLTTDRPFALHSVRDTPQRDWHWSSRQQRVAASLGQPDFEPITAVDPDAFELIEFIPVDDFTRDPIQFADDADLPSLEDQAFELGRMIGLTGGDAVWEAIVRDQMPALLGNGTLRKPDFYRGERGFCGGLFAGQSAWSRQIGYEMGLAGEDIVPPVSRALKPNRFDGGYADGVADRLDRERIMAASSPADDWHEAELAEAGAGSRLVPVVMEV